MKFDHVFEFKITLRGIKPPVWRRIQVPCTYTFWDLHVAIQDAMGWLDYHLWEFVIDGRTYGLPTDEDWGTRPRKEAAKVRLREVLKPGETLIDYVYDFGDGWEHEIRVSDIRKGAPEIGYPRYVAGERNGPPEDCGGLPGFYNLLEARADPGHPDHADAVAWLEDYDPDLIEELPIKYALGRIAARRNAAKARLAKPSSA